MDFDYSTTNHEAGEGEDFDDEESITSAQTENSPKLIHQKPKMMILKQISLPMSTTTMFLI